jgi:hypothetical protein
VPPGPRGRRSLRGGALLLALLALLCLGPVGAIAALPDGRGWELVSPVDKNGGEIAAPAEAGIGAFGAAPQGGAIAYASAASFGQAAGAAPFSQYLASRGSSGWLTENITPAHLAGAYQGDPYVSFSADLARALYLNPSRCPAGDPCPPGYRWRDNLTGAHLGSPANPGLFEGASEDLRHAVFAAGSDLYLWSPPAGALTLVNGAPASGLAAGEGGVSSDGARVYWQGADGNLHLRDGASTVQIDGAQGGGGTFELASADAGVALFSKAGHLYRYLVATGAAVDLTPGGGVTALLGASADAARLYYLAGPSLFVWQQGAATQIAIGANLSDVVPETAGVTADGARLFLTTAGKLVAADTNNDADVYEWEASGTGTCAKAAGCIELISSGRSEEGASFVDASASGADVFFLTDGSLVASDPGSVDLYDARIGGGFPEPPIPIPCNGDSCQGLPSEPLDPALGTLFAGPGNPAVRYRRYRRRGHERCRRAGKARGCRAQKQGGKGGR